MSSKWMGFKCLLVMGGLAASVLTHAGGVPADIDAALRKNLGKIPQLQINNINTTPLAEIYQITLDSGEILHVHKEGKYFLSGELFALQDAGGLKNLTEESRSQGRQKIVKSINKADVITFAAKGTEKSEIYVFTDIDCGYCRKFHAEVPAMNDKGVTVHYLAWPRAGLESDIGKQMHNIWCSEDPQSALTLAKQGKAVPDGKAKNCSRSIKSQYELGFTLGVDGTPAVYLTNGRKIGGYLSADDLVKAMQ